MAESKDLSHEFVTDMIEGAASVILGSTKSGKSVWTSSVVRAGLELGVWTRAYLILPTYKFERKGTYDWLAKLAKSLPKTSTIKIFDTFNDDVASLITKECQKNLQHTVCWVDDFTSMVGGLHNLSGSGANQKSAIVEMLTLKRHLRLTLFFTGHGAKSVLHPLIRSNLTFICLTDIRNEKLLRGVWEESFSLLLPWSNFQDHFKNHLAKKYGVFVVKLTGQGGFDVDASEWVFVKQRIDLLLKEITG